MPLFAYTGVVTWNQVNRRAIQAHDLPLASDTSTLTLEESQDLCLNTDGCLSINYGSSNIQLNNVTRLDASTDWVSDLGANYDIYYASKGVFGGHSALETSSINTEIWLHDKSHELRTLFCRVVGFLCFCRIYKIYLSILRVPSIPQCQWNTVCIFLLMRWGWSLGIK